MRSEMRSWELSMHDLLTDLFVICATEHINDLLVGALLETAAAAFSQPILVSLHAFKLNTTVTSTLKDASPLSR